MIKINVHKTKIQLPKMIDRVESGEELTIVRSGVPVARLAPVNQPGVTELGVDKERIFISPDFDSPLPPEIKRSFSMITRERREFDE